MDRERVDLEPFGAPGVWDYKSLNVKQLPIETITGDLRQANGKIRCKLEYLNVINQGTYGKIQRVKRTDASGVKLLVCKKPTMECEKNQFAQEALIQHIAGKALTAAGLGGAVATVFDIYQFGDEKRFTMEYIEGNSALDEIYRSADPGATFLSILTQLSLILLVLERNLRLDHRDLKMTNLWIRHRPCVYHCGGWRVVAPFQLVILDFGFICLGESGVSVVNLADLVFPPLDPCPKEGRDIFQCLVSLWGVPIVRDRLPVQIRSIVEGWLGKHASRARQFADPTGSWAYAIVADPKFAVADLLPATVLGYLAKHWPQYVTHEQGRGF